MAFEEYQFLRYFIPGSLFVIYTTLIAFPILSSTAIAMLGNPETLLGVIGGAFAGSLAIGYITYTFYDTFLYNRLAMNTKRRLLLQYLPTKIKEWDSLLLHEKKMVMEMIHNTGKDTEACDRFYNIIRGWWSHFNARWVCLLFVPLLSGFSVLFLLSLNIILGGEIFAFNLPNLFLYVPIALVIVTISLVLKIGAENPFNEATQFEYYFVKYKIENNEEDFKEMIAILLEKKWKTHEA